MLFEEPTGRQWIVTELGRTSSGAIGIGDRLPEPTSILLSYESDGERRLVSNAPSTWRTSLAIEECFFGAFRHGEDRLSIGDAAAIEEFGRQLDTYTASQWGGIRVAASVRSEAISLAERIREELSEGLAAFSDADLTWLNEHGRGFCDAARSDLQTLAHEQARRQAQARWAQGCALRFAGVRLRQEMYGG